MKLLKRIFGLIILLIVVAIFARNIIVKIGAEQAVKKITGLPLKIEGLSIGLKETNIDIDDLKLYNPGTYKDKIMANIPDIYVDYNLPDIIKGNIHLNDIRFHLNEFIVIKNKDGQMNIDSLKSMQEANKSKEGKPKKEEKSQKKKAMQIDNLSLRVDRVVYKDYSGGGEPQVKTYDINLNESHNDIDNLETVVSLIVVKALLKTPLAALPDFAGLENLAGGLSGTLMTGTKFATDAVKDATDLLGDTGESLTDKAKGLKGLFKK